MSAQKFPMGVLLATKRVHDRIHVLDVLIGLRRHSRGDWGDVCPADHAANERALRDGLRLLSVYHSADGQKFWIITEADRSVTTVMFPDD